MSRKPNKNNAGLTLLEISFVVVFLAIIFSAISLGKNLQENARIQNFIQESQKYMSATAAFRDNYTYLPGDYPNASDVFTGCGSTAAECDGNGDGILDEGTAGSDSEVLRFWEHLTLSGVIDEYYSGESAGVPQPTISENCPKVTGFFGNGGFFVNNVDYFSSTQNNAVFSLTGGYNALLIGLPSSATDLEFLGSIISPALAKKIDDKIDDGLPEYGNVMAFDGENNASLLNYVADNCLSGTEGAAAYAETTNTDSCHLAMRID